MSEQTQMDDTQFDDPPVQDTAPSDVPDALIAALVEIERHVSRSGWDQPARLFALVRTDELIRQEPSLAAHLAVGAPDGLSSIEQEDFHGGDDLLDALSKLTWPATVSGCALALERTFLTSEHEGELPDDPAAQAEFVAQHPQRQEVRVVVGALRDGSTHGVGRLVSNPDDLFGSPALVPALMKACQETLR